MPPAEFLHMMGLRFHGKKANVKQAVYMWCAGSHFHDCTETGKCPSTLWRIIHISLFQSGFIPKKHVEEEKFGSVNQCRVD